MIISASRRTDIPCYYSEWFINRLRDGYVMTRNPFNNAQIRRVELTPDAVDCIVFWSKDAKNILPYLDEIDGMGFKYYFQFTVTPYGRDLEPYLRGKDLICETFAELSRRVGSEKTVWRYDPIVINDVYSVSYHKQAFEGMCEKLSPFTSRVVISFVDMYNKLNNSQVRSIDDDEIHEISAFVGEITSKHGICAYTCCEKHDLSVYGIEHSACIDKQLAESICGQAISAPPDKNQRAHCGCAASIDIGAYNTCPNGCVYCYANRSHASAARRHERLMQHKSSEFFISDQK